MATKTIYIQTNYNNKLACDAFVHIDVSPKVAVTERMLESIDFEIRTIDNSHPPIKAKVVNIINSTLTKVAYSCVTWPSHAMDGAAYVKMVMDSNPEINGDSQFSIYFYQKIEA